MNLNKLEKASKILEQIKTLDKQILELDQFAIKVANCDTDCTVKIDLVNLFKEPKKEEVFDEYGSIKNLYLGKPEPVSFYSFGMDLHRSFLGQLEKDKKIKPVPDKSLEHRLTDKETLQILGIMLNSRHEARKLLLVALNKLGYETT